MTIAGGIMGALFHRERTGEATVVDVSLLATGMWAMGQAIALSLVLDRPWAPPPNESISANPLSRTYATSDGRVLVLHLPAGGEVLADLCAVLERPDLATDERFADHESLMANRDEAIEILTGIFAAAPLEDWRKRLEPFTGQWAVVQDTLEAAVDPQSVANGYMQDCETASGTPFQLVAAPVQYDEEPAVPARAPEFNEHGDDILADLGIDWDTVVDLKVRGVVA